MKGTKEVDLITASSEFTFNLMLSTIRKLPNAFNGVLQGEWRNNENKYRGRELSSLKLGIIGYGRIGRNLAKYSKTFGMKVNAYDPYVNIKDSYVTQTNNLDALLSEADVICTCVHLNEETKHMINADVFKKMKDGVVFINTSRGDVVNEHDLITYLSNGKIARAGVDVISNEFVEKTNNHPLINYAKSNENLIITPHIAGLTYDSEEKAQSAAYNAIKEFFND